MSLSSSPAPQPEPVVTAKAPSPAPEAPKVDEKKAAKAAAREEAERKAREAKAAAEAAAEAKRLAEAEAAASALKAAEDVFATGLQGPALKEHVTGLSVKPTGAALLAIVLAKVPEAKNMKWTAPASYGGALKALLEGNVKEQVSALFEVQRFCNAQSFPKIEVKGEQRYLIEVMFQVLYQVGMVEGDAIFLWAEDESDAVPGKANAVIQTTKLISVLRDAEQDDDESDEDDDGEDLEEEQEHL